jgi:hypothetical protein
MPNVAFAAAMGSCRGRMTDHFDDTRAAVRAPTD